MTDNVESALRKLLYRGAKGTQDDIAAELTRLGVEATQSSVSRALKRLRAVKTRARGGGVIWKLPQEPASEQASGSMRELVTSVQSNGTLIVVHTEPGAAARIAYFLDHVRPGGIIGTVAGDDTIFLAPPGGVRIELVVKAVKSSLE